MKKLIQIAERYIQTSDWKTFAVLKLCLLSLGIAMGMSVPETRRKHVFAGSIAVFVASYVPLMKKFFALCGESKEKKSL